MNIDDKIPRRRMVLGNVCLIDLAVGGVLAAFLAGIWWPQLVSLFR